MNVEDKKTLSKFSISPRICILSYRVHITHSESTQRVITYAFDGQISNNNVRFGPFIFVKKQQKKKP